MSTTSEPAPDITIPAPRTSPENAPPPERRRRWRRLTAWTRRGPAGGRGPEPAGEPGGGSAAESGGAPGRAWLRRPTRRTAAVAALAALLLAAGGLRYADHRLADPAAAGNRALTDSAATDRVTGDVSNALGKIFAYTPDSTAATEQAARDLLDGTAARQYQALFAQIRQRVGEQQLTLTTRVVRAGVVTLTADRARLLVFLDQTAQRKGAPATSAAAQLSVTARLEGGQWRITDLTAR
ncbi:hypothetical protein AB0M29_26020 [Streptomyces sp. NPDC051976]|uniref:hypothetical protein n=1 Tax=Streptomyces sp. NPDC051976 TaxID=3154947 RepID=UPI003417D3CC